MPTTEAASRDLRSSRERGRVPVSPFLKWAGSKRLLLPRIAPKLPTKFTRYFEPFLGGGSLFFSVRPEKGFLSDLNPTLISTYKAVRDDYSKVVGALKDFSYRKESYYLLRDVYRPTNRWEVAARFITLNKTCWNGLYRENLKGEFNVPFGSPGRRNIPELTDQLREAAGCLRGMSIDCMDFSTALRKVRKGDFVYLDPPYVTAHRNNGFVEYNSRIFSWDDQERLARECRRLRAIGAMFLMTNGAHASVAQLYRGFNEVRIRRESTIAADPQHRKRCEEALIIGGYKTDLT